MSRLTLHTQDTAPKASQAFVAKVIANNGFLPNLIGVLANSPQALQTYMTVSGINTETSLSLSEREVVQITAARIHGCDFCVAGHTAVAVKKARLPVELVRALHQGSDTGDTRLDAVRQFTEAVIGSRGAVADARYCAFIDAGYNEQQALEVVLGISLATLCNFANTLAGTAVNLELQPYASGAI